MYTDPRNSWVREVAGGVPSLCSVLSWASSVHFTACYCVMYCFIQHHRIKTYGDWKNGSTCAYSRQKVEVTGRSVIQSGRLPLVKKLGRSCSLSATRKHLHDRLWDRWNGAGGQTCICEVFRVGIQPFVVVFGALPVNVWAITKCTTDGCRKNCPIQDINGKVRDGNNIGKDFVPLVQIIEWTCLLITNIDLEKLVCYKM